MHKAAIVSKLVSIGTALPLTINQRSERCYFLYSQDSNGEGIKAFFFVPIFTGRLTIKSQALEVLFLRGENGKKREMLAKRIAVLLGNSDTDIQCLYSKVKNIYVDRSDAVHDGVTTNITRNSLDELRNLIRDIGRKYITHIQSELVQKPNLTFAEAKDTLVDKLIPLVVQKITDGVLPQ